MTTCRVCGEGASLERARGKLIKYGVRHYAHADCALTRWGASFFDRLRDWPLKRFPAMNAERAGLLQALETAIAARETSGRARECHGP
jgi:hypothetical protein